MPTPYLLRLEQVKQLVAQNLTCAEIIKHLGFTPSSVYHIVRRHKLTNSAIETSKASVRNGAIPEELFRSLIPTMSFRDIAKHLGYGLSTVRHYAKKYGIKSVFTLNSKSMLGYTSKKRVSQYDTTDWTEVQRLYDTGSTWRDLMALGYKECTLTKGRKEGKFKTRTSGETLKLYASRYDRSHLRTPEHRAKMSAFGGLRRNSGRCKTYYYHSKYAGIVYLTGTWELQYAVWLDSHNINWQRNLKGFNYEYNGKTYKYYPDIFLPDTNTYVEIKGYTTDKDAAKWSAFRKEHTLVVLGKTEVAAAPYNFILNLKHSKTLTLISKGLSIPTSCKPVIPVKKKRVSRDGYPWPPLAELKSLVWAHPMVYIAKLLHASDKGIKRKCERENIPVPPQGYWRRREIGQTHEQALSASSRPTQQLLTITCR